MPVEQRIIGGGLLVGGIGVVLVLLFVINWGGLSPQEGLDKILNDLYPAYTEAAEKGDYLAQKRVAAEILTVFDEAGKAGIAKFLEGSATTNREHKQLFALMREEAFEKNADGRYSYDGGWYSDTTHRALTQFESAVGDLKGLRVVRRAAADATKAVAEIRTGSGAALEAPAPKKVPTVTNPIFAHDAELYRVFGVSGEAVDGALASKDTSGRAKSARLRWNNQSNDSHRSNLSAAVESIPEQADNLRRTATTIESAAGKLVTDASAGKAAQRLLGKAAVLLGSDLGGEHATAYAAMRAEFETGAKIAAVLRAEADMLAAHGATVRGLGAALGKKFAE